MEPGGKVILIGAGACGQIALSFYGPDRVLCFADNYKYGSKLYGKDVISLAELKRICGGRDVVISANFADAEAIKRQCGEMGIKAAAFGEKASWRDYPANPKIAAFKDLHRNERCFLIGNGPSLRMDDLERLKGEASFGCNRIYRAYESSGWRPLYYTAADSAFIEVSREEIAAAEAKVRFIQNPGQMMRGGSRGVTQTFENAPGETHFFNKIIVSSRESDSFFSPDPSRAVYMSGTVMHVMLQLAVYMGFNPIYFLGADNTFAGSLGETAYDSESGAHFYAEKEGENDKYFSVHGRRESMRPAELVNTWYRAAAGYLKERGVAAFNATRGGRLDAFERVEFDGLFG